MHLVRCEKNEEVSVRLAFCMSYNNASGMTLVGYCPYVNEGSNYQRGYIVQPKNKFLLNEELCGWANRTGFLCSRCKEGLGVSVMTYDNKCVECIGKWKGWILYLFLAIAPTTIFFIFVISCKVRSASGYMNSMLCLFQVITFYVDRYPFTIINTTTNSAISKIVLYIAITVSGFWNLDFFRHIIPNFCISEDMTTLNIIAMEYIVAFYPLVLIATTYILIELYDKDFRLFQILWAPFKWILSRMNWTIERPPLIDAFATFLHLSYTKLIFVSFNLISYVALYDSKGKRVYPNVLYYAGEVPYLSLGHLPYFILAITVLLMFVMLPLLILFFYPTRIFQRFLNLFPSINWHPLHVFADAFNGCFKNGIDGSRDLRYFGSFYLLFRVVFYLTAVISEVESGVIVTFLPLVASLMFAFLKPYKNKFLNILDATLFSSLEMTQIWVVYNLYAFSIPKFLTIIFYLIPFMYMVLLFTYKILSVCAPGTLKKLKSYRVVQLISRDLAGKDVTSTVLSNITAMGDEQHIDDQGVPDRLINPENYQSLDNDVSQGSTSFEYYYNNYGSLNERISDS